MCIDVYRRGEMPKISSDDLVQNAVFECDGFRFHVDFITADEVYYVKYQGEDRSLCRMPIAEFVRQFNERASREAGGAMTAKKLNRIAFQYARKQMLEFLRDAEQAAKDHEGADIALAFQELRLRCDLYTRLAPQPNESQCWECKRGVCTKCSGGDCQCETCHDTVAEEGR